MTRSNLHLYLLSNTFPFGDGEQFLETEIHYLAARFERITIVPSNIWGVQRPLPPQVDIDASLAATRGSGVQQALRVVWNSLRSIQSYKEFLSHFRYTRKPRALSTMMVYQDNATRVDQWLSSGIASNKIDLSHSLFYIYWLVPQSLGFARARKRYPAMKVAARAHGSDLYEYAHVPPYIPFRQQTFQSLDHVFTVSQHGKTYIETHYADFQPTVEVHRLGINAPGFINPPPSPSVFTIISCSFMVEIKQLHILVAALNEVAQLEPNTLIEWHHIGDGPLRQIIEEQANTSLPPSVKSIFHGHFDNQQIFEFYRQHPLDVFINVSRSEGLPVSIMEAQGCGIPVIAPAIGGIPEIVNDDNGILLPANPDVHIVASAIQRLMREADNRLLKRENSKQTWQEKCSAERNYATFASRLIELFG